MQINFLTAAKRYGGLRRSSFDRRLTIGGGTKLDIDSDEFSKSEELRPLSALSGVKTLS